MSQTLLAIPLPEQIERRLDELARKTGRTKAFYATEAVIRHLEEMEDVYIAEERLKNPGSRYTLKEAKEELGLDD